MKMRHHRKRKHEDVCGNGFGPCRYYIQHKMIWDGLVELAHKVADKLNQEEQK